jgi:hypothetical protein
MPILNVVSTWAPWRVFGRCRQSVPDSIHAGSPSGSWNSPSLTDYVAILAEYMCNEKRPDSLKRADPPHSQIGLIGLVPVFGLIAIRNSGRPLPCPQIGSVRYHDRTQKYGSWCSIGIAHKRRRHICASSFCYSADRVNEMYQRGPSPGESPVMYALHWVSMSMINGRDIEGVDL